MSPLAASKFAFILAENARVAGMTALNMQRQAQGYSMAYSDEDFFNAAARIDTLAIELANLS